MDIYLAVQNKKGIKCDWEIWKELYMVCLLTFYNGPYQKLSQTEDNSFDPYST